MYLFYYSNCDDLRGIEHADAGFINQRDVIWGKNKCLNILLYVLLLDLYHPYMWF